MNISEEKLQQCQEEFKLVQKKIVDLRQQYLLESDAAVKLKLEKQIAADDAEQERIEGEFSKYAQATAITQADLRHVEFGMEVVIEKLQVIEIQLNQLGKQMQGLLAQYHQMSGQIV